MDEGERAAAHESGTHNDEARLQRTGKVWPHDALHTRRVPAATHPFIGAVRQRSARENEPAATPASDALAPFVQPAALQGNLGATSTTTHSR